MSNRSLDNPFNRCEFNPNFNQWVVIVTAGPEGPALATRSAFEFEADARRYMATIATCYKPVLARVKSDCTTTSL
jgi:hypothetical protein